MLSLSTAYMSPTGKSGEKIVKKAINLGFNCIEINVEINYEQIKQISNFVEKGKIKVSSVHNFSPRLEHIPRGQTIYGGYLISSNNPEEQEKSVELTKKTIDIAVMLNAPAIVIHAGTIDTELSGRELFKYVSQFGKAMLFEKYKQEIIKQREENKKQYLENVINNLSRINEYAIKKKIKLGIENRFYYNEIPGFDEIGIIIDKLKENIYYWHDVGHAEIFTRLGFVQKHIDYLDTYSKNLLGIHFHDVKGFQDHLAPGTGDVDFSIFKKYISDNTIKVIETHQYSSEKELKKSHKFLEIYGIK